MRSTKPFNRFFLRSVDGFVYMSEQVRRELAAYTDAPALFSPHPLFEHFGGRVDRREACVRLGLDPAVGYASFRAHPRLQGVGFVVGCVGPASARGAHRRQEADCRRRVLYFARALFEADCRARIAGRGHPPRPFHSRRRGEVLFFGGRLRRPALQDCYAERRHADCLPVLYAHDCHERRRARRNRARRSGGVRLPALGRGVADAIERIYAPGVLERFRENCIEERRRFSWEEMCSRIVELYNMVR